MRTITIRNSGRSVAARTCGEESPTLIIGSIGTSDEGDSIDKEIEKARVAESLGADVVTDHSFYGDIPAYHKELTRNLSILVSSVGCYEFAARHQGHGWRNKDKIDAIRILEEQVDRGIDMITVHASLKASHLAILTSTKRLIPTTSKGGGIVASYMRSTHRENPYYEYFDDILRIFHDANVTLSLGTTFRPATVCDSWDDLMATEIETMAELTARALEKGVATMVEGFGHASLAAIPTYIKLTKSYCYGVPYRILPMATDTALGFDHISGAIATAAAVAAGADAVTCMSRAEHIGLPREEDIREAVISARIASHCGELVKLGDYSKDYQMSRTRWGQGCKGDWTAAVYPEGAREALNSHNRLNDQLIQCGMCGDFCGIAAGIASHKAAQRAKT